MADEFLYKETVNPSDVVSPMVSKRLYYVVDQNGPSYSGQITFSTKSLGTSGDWAAYSEAYIEVPLVITAKSSVDISAVDNAFMVGLKNGYYQLIDSIQVDLDGRSIVSVTNFTNIFTNYKLMTSFSHDDLVTHGPSIGFWPDSAGSFVYADHVAAAGGDGYSNNRDLITLATFTTPENYNKGFLERRRLTTAFPLATSNTVTTKARAAAVGKNYYSNDGAGAAARYYSWVVMAQIRLKDIADYFDKVPLMKNADYRITLNYNSCNLAITGAGNTFVIAANGVTMLSGRTCPLLVANSAANNSGAGLSTAGAVTLSIGIAGNALHTASDAKMSLPMTQCRLYVPAYSMNPVHEAEMISIMPTRKIKYMDVYNYEFSGIAAGGSFNQLLNQSVTNPKFLVLIPYATQGKANEGLFLNVSVPTWQSPFDTSPSTSCPAAAITQFQVQVGGANMFQQNVQFDFDMFTNEVVSAGSINGGMSTGLTSGLIGQYEWDNAYRYYVCDLSRRLPAEDSVGKSISVLGTNATAVSLDFVTFIVYERSITVDMVTGKIVD